MLWVTDVAASMVHIRPEWESLTGQPPADALGDGWVSKVHPDDQALVLDTLRTATHRQEAFVLRNRLRMSVGGYNWVISGGSPSIAPMSGKFLGYLGTLTVLSDEQVQGNTLANGSLGSPTAALRDASASEVDDLADQVIYARELAFQAKETGVLNILDLALAEIGFRIAQGDKTAALLKTLRSRLS